MSLNKALQIDPSLNVTDVKKRIQSFHDNLLERATSDETIETLIEARSHFIDQLLIDCWHHLLKQHAGELALIATGGYGREELHPYSDIDLLIIFDESKLDQYKSELESFSTFLWDIGLKPGLSVRTISDCVEQSKLDITVITNLMEARLITGSDAFFADMQNQISINHLWSPAEFFHEKVAEQEKRHLKFGNTAYNLEPDVKEGPGGLRDIQTIQWVTQRYFGSNSLGELVNHAFLTKSEYRTLIKGQRFLWKVRFELHLLAKRPENRLLFDYQKNLALAFGFEDGENNLAVESFMQQYYRTVMDLERTNELILQIFNEALENKVMDVVPINESFRVINNYIEVTHPDTFKQDPTALLDIILQLQKHDDIKGVRSATIRLIRESLHLIDDEFRSNPRAQRLFLDIIRQPHGITHQFRRMNRYGLLAAYIPAFNDIIGRMQYDLFHAYTVDAHTLFVVENLRRFALPRFDHEHPECSGIMQSISKPEIAYLAGLFHDIAKGRGGDHSTLGAVDAEAFCLEHGMSRYDARLLAWLVKNHLLLSMTSQKKDLNDPVVINEFAHIVGDETHLDYLYVLTVADVRGTNPKIWNSWKNSLFWELYQLTKRALRRGFSEPIDAKELISETQTQAEEILKKNGVKPKSWKPVWDNFTNEYYLRHKPEEIAWHTGILAEEKTTNKLVVDVSDHASEGLTAIMVYAPKKPSSFGRTTAVLDQLGLTVADARIVPMSSAQTLNTYCVLENDGQPISNIRRLQEIRTRVLKALTADTDKKLTVNRQASRRVRMFDTEVQVSIAQDHDNCRTVLELVTGDRPGLLLQISQIFEQHNVSLHNAKITTLGEKAEDIFFITTNENMPLHEQLCNELISTMKTTLSQPSHK
ncbi:MAG TPA: [protein-PII] uridylyltransferase [Methylococcaceae bacterium]|nr:[protein-PII] uridylyltransferase [Methylococcaceae bacterium]